MKKRIMVWMFLFLMFLSGIGLVVYPVVSAYYTDKHQSEIHTQFQEAMEQADDSEKAAARESAERYNRQLASGMPVHDEALDYDNLLNLAGNGIMGYIEIPAIDVLLPIYHGVGKDSLEHGAGHMPGTSLPIGGKGTHAVISAHTGMATSRMFTDLEQLEVGDLFYIHVLDETLTYEVDQILVVKPYQIEALEIDTEQDYVTLVTCTPYGVNSHRLLVRGHRVETAINNSRSISDVTAVEDTPRQSTWMVKYWEGILQGLAIGLAVALTLCLLRFARKRRKRGRYEA